MINCCAQVACYAIKMIGSGLMFYKTGAGIHVQNWKLFTWVENIWGNQGVEYYDVYFMEI